MDLEDLQPYARLFQPGIVYSDHLRESFQASRGGSSAAKPAMNGIDESELPKAASLAYRC